MFKLFNLFNAVSLQNSIWLVINRYCSMGWFDELCSETTPMRNTLYQFLVAIVNVSSSTLAVVNEPIIYMESMRLQPRVMHARSLFVRNFKRNSYAIHESALNQQNRHFQISSNYKTSTIRAHHRHTLFTWFRCAIKACQIGFELMTRTKKSFTAN